MLSDRGPALGIDRAGLLGALMRLPNDVWSQIMSRAKVDVSTLLAPEVVREVTKIVKTNVRVCSAIGPLYVSQVIQHMHY